MEGLPEAVIDGELVMLDSQGMPLYNRLRARIARRRRPPRREEPETPAIFAFDILAVHGQDLREQPLIERKDALKRLLKRTKRIRYLQHVHEHGEALYRHFEDMGLEGVVGKQASAKYKAGPTQTWKKVKTPAFKEIEARRLEHIRK